MALTNWLIDKSAYLRLAASPDAEDWLDRVQRGLVRISTVTRLEIGYSARNHVDAVAETAGLLSYMPIEYFTPAIEDRVVAVQLELARRGHHRAPSIPDLLIAATAELAKLTVLAVDKDFDLIADITGQHVETLRMV